MSKCYTNYTNIGKFISNINENWRNSIYITCSVCKYKKENCCDDILLSFDADGNPTFIAVSDANYIFSTIIDKSECLCEISNEKFRCLFERLIVKHTNDQKCPFLQLTQIHNFSDISESGNSSQHLRENLEN